VMVSLRRRVLQVDSDVRGRQFSVGVYVPNSTL
jgi:hypothetical protein